MSRLSSCRICGADEAICNRCSTLARRRSPIAYCDPTNSKKMSRVIRWSWSSARAAHFCKSPRRCLRKSSSENTSTAPVSRIRCCATRQELADRLVVERSLVHRAWSWKPPATMGIYLQYFTQQNVRVCGIEPARTSPEQREHAVSLPLMNSSVRS